LHVLAGREAARRQGAAEGVIASDVIAALPSVRNRGKRGEGGDREERTWTDGGQTTGSGGA
jgi:hypothetical protein